jgi:hypothetical protein
MRARHAATVLCNVADVAHPWDWRARRAVEVDDCELRLSFDVAVIAACSANASLGAAGERQRHRDSNACAVLRLG